MANLYSLVLTNEILPGSDPKAVWSSLASLFGIEENKLTEKIPQAPFILKQDENLGLIQSLWTEITKAGIRCEICSPDERPMMFVNWEGIPRGPLPYSLLMDRIKKGTWPPSVPVAVVGSNEWKPFAQMDPANTATAIPEPVVAPTTVLQAQPTPLSMPPVAPSPTQEPLTPMTPWAPNAPAVQSQIPAPQTGITSALPNGPQTQSQPAPIGYYAGFWKRFAAALIDLAVLFIPLGIASIIPILNVPAIIVGPWLYNALMESSPHQGSLGKMAMNIKVVDLHGNPLSFGRATGRHFSKFITGMTFTVGYIMAGFTDKKQCLHDMIAETLVINNPQK